MPGRNATTWLWYAAIATLALAGLGSAQDKAADKWEKDIAAFEAQDQKSPPPTDGVVFVGSSSIRKWDLTKSFPDLPAINRGFGGSQLADSVKYAKRIVTPYRPKTVVVYAGDNDIAAGQSPQQIADDFASFVKKVRAALPETKIVFVAIKPSPARWKFYDQQREANELVRRQCAAGKNLTYLDVVRPMLTDDGTPRRELFVQDQLHLSETGYQLWTELLTPHLR